MLENETQTLIQMALKEDCPSTDITCQSLCLSNTPIEAKIIAKEPGIFFGHDVALMIRNAVDTTLNVTCHVQDGAAIANQQTLLSLSGPSLSLLRAERVLLNFLQRLCGIATTTHQYVQALNNPNIAILDTRKTTPGLRHLEKQAVVAGGGKNHRHSLSDMMLIKENHLRALSMEGRLNDLETCLIAHKKSHPLIPTEVEVETLDQIRTFPLHLVDYVMFDNFTPDMIKEGVTLLKARNIQAEIEISGGVTLDTLPLYRILPIHRISIGALTHSVKALDLSLLANDTVY